MEPSWTKVEHGILEAIRCLWPGGIPDELRSKDRNHAIEKWHRDSIAAMVTYPSTHGVFEETVREICAITHANGGQVYLDGANLNALIGLARPATSAPTWAT